jgi:TonB family protein
MESQLITKPLAAVLSAVALLLAQEPSRSNVSPPVVLSKTEPDYTEEARRARVNASVTLKLIVRPDGNASDIRVIRAAGFGLDENAIECVRTWQFAPGTKDGKALSVAATIEVNFRLLAKDNEGQHARLTFTLPTGAGRPELVKGTIPRNPNSSAPDQRFRIGLTVDSKGKTENLAIIDTTDPEWADRALHELQNWRFVAASVNGQTAPVNGVFELAAGSLRYLH